MADRTGQIAWRPTTALSDREMDVVEMFSRGFKWAEIAESLAIGAHSARTYLARARIKLAAEGFEDVGTRRGLIAAWDRICVEAGERQRSSSGPDETKAPH